MTEGDVYDVYVLQHWGWDDHPVLGLYLSLEAAMEATGTTEGWEMLERRAWYLQREPQSASRRIERWPLSFTTGKNPLPADSGQPAQNLGTIEAEPG